MGAVTKTISSVFGGGGGSSTQQTAAAITAAPKPAASPMADVATLARERLDAERKRRGRAANILAGEGSAPGQVGTKRLLGE